MYNYRKTFLNEIQELLSTYNHYLTSEQMRDLEQLRNSEFVRMLNMASIKKLTIANEGGRDSFILEFWNLVQIYHTLKDDIDNTF